MGWVGAKEKQEVGAKEEHKVGAKEEQECWTESSPCHPGSLPPDIPTLRELSV